MLTAIQQAETFSISKVKIFPRLQKGRNPAITSQRETEAKTFLRQKNITYRNTEKMIIMVQNVFSFAHA